MAIEMIGKITAFTDTQANVEANAAALGEICFARRTDDNVLGFSLDNGFTWNWIIPSTTPPPPTTGRYRQWLYAASSGNLTILTDIDGNPLTGLCDLE
jgi:hypothetical protein